MRDQNQQEKIKDIQAHCEMHWLVNRIPQDRSEEMADELGQHLEEAVQDGKSVEDVVGSDVTVFAESWAEENRPAWSAKDYVVEYVSALLFGVVYAAVAFHLLTWTSVLSVHWSAVPVILFMSWFLNRMVFKPRSQDTRPWWRRWLWPTAAILLAVLVWSIEDELKPIREAANVAVTGNLDGTLFEWPWYGTLVVVVTSLAIGKLSKGA